MFDLNSLVASCYKKYLQLVVFMRQFFTLKVTLMVSRSMVIFKHKLYNNLSLINNKSVCVTLGISFPSVDQQIKLLRSTYKEAGLDPQEISYVEAHGTGTKVGDPIECHAIKTVFAKKRQQPLLIGSVKSNAGHAEPGSGILGISKVS